MEPYTADGMARREAEQSNGTGGASDGDDHSVTSTATQVRDGSLTKLTILLCFS